MGDGADKALAHHRPHGAAHETKLERRGDQRDRLQGARHGDQRIFLTDVFLSLADALTIALGIAKLERILGLQIGR